MRNIKGFTLIELLAVIVVIGLIMLIAVPNIVGLSTGVRKDQMLDDAKKLISLAKYQVNVDIDIRSLSKDGICDGTECELSIDYLNKHGDIGLDPDGQDYSSDSKVIYRLNNGVAEYCITLIGSARTIGVPTCVSESDLYSRSNVHDIE
jgi:type IV pilus assembly protein PilA